jgi:limonene 1,2-monooxygenase
MSSSEAKMASPDALRFGMFMGPFHATNLDPTYALKCDLQRVTLLDQLGFDEAWIGEHHCCAGRSTAVGRMLLAPWQGASKVISHVTCISEAAALHG